MPITLIRWHLLSIKPAHTMLCHALLFNPLSKVSHLHTFKIYYIFQVYQIRGGIKILFSSEKLYSLNFALATHTLKMITGKILLISSFI